MQDYETLLEEARKQLPKEITTSSRYEIPKVKGHVEGNKTIVINFSQICSIFNREPEHILKYLQKELATPAKIGGGRLILGRKLSSSLINAKVQEYADNFVLCYTCKKPDTALIKDDGHVFIKCTACGAKHRVKYAI